MVTVTKIRFEDGGVTITQTFDRNEKKTVDNTSPEAPANPKAGGTTGEGVDLPDSFSGAGRTRSAVGFLTPSRAARTGEEGAGDYGPTDPGSGGGALSGGLTVVFGSLIMDCGADRVTSGKTVSGGTVRTRGAATQPVAGKPRK